MVENSREYVIQERKFQVGFFGPKIVNLDNIALDKLTTIGYNKGSMDSIMSLGRERVQVGLLSVIVVNLMKRSGR